MRAYEHEIPARGLVAQQEVLPTFGSYAVVLTCVTLSRVEWTVQLIHRGPFAFTAARTVRFVLALGRRSWETHHFEQTPPC